MPRTDKTSSSSTANGNDQHRRSNKPVMEKKRRARINNCLNELKSLLMEAMRKDPTRHSKLEKADILEMTVKHLQDMHSMRRHLAAAAASNVDSAAAVVTKYRAGFNECATEVARFVARSENDAIGPGAKQRLLVHLANSSMDIGMRLRTPASSCSMPASSTISAMAAARSQRRSDAMAALLNLNSSGRSPHQLHSHWSRLHAGPTSSSSSSSMIAHFGGDNHPHARPLPSAVTVNCCQRSPVSDEDQGFATCNSGTEDQSSSPCSSRNSDSAEADIVCIDDDDDDDGDDGYDDAHDDRSSDAGHPEGQKAPREPAVPIIMPVNLSKDVDKMWRPW